MKMQNLKPGTIVTSTYRVEPFLADERFVVVNSDTAAKGRTYVQSVDRKAIAGWQYTADLEVSS